MEDTTYKTLDFKTKAMMHLMSFDNKLEMIIKMTEFGDVIRATGTQTRFFINDPETIYQVLVQNAKQYTKGATTFMKAKDFLGVGLLTEHGEAWRKNSKVIKPHFYYNNLEQCMQVINQCTDEMLDEWEKTYADKRKSVNAVDEISKLAFRIACGVLFGQNIKTFSRRAIRNIRFANEYVSNVKNLWPLKPTIPNLRYQFCKKYIDKICYNLLMEPHDDFAELNPLLEPFFLNIHSSKEDIERGLGNAKNVLLAGHETTALSLCWSLYCLTSAPQFYESLYDDVEKTLSDATPTFESYKKLHSTERTIQEAMRLYPPVWTLERTAMEDDQFGPYEVPKGSYIFMCPYTIQRHPRYWEYPDYFNPNRFTPQNSKNRPKCAYIPFGMGERVCVGKHLGMMMAICILAKIVQRFHFRLESDEAIMTDPLITLRLYPDLKIRIQSK